MTWFLSVAMPTHGCCWVRRSAAHAGSSILSAVRPHPESRSTGLRHCMREPLARLVVSSCAGGVAIGQLNEQFYRQYGAPCITLAPYSVDDERFAGPPEFSREQILGRWGLDSRLPTLMFSGKLIPRRRPLDLATASSYLPERVNTLFVGCAAAPRVPTAGSSP